MPQNDQGLLIRLRDSGLDFVVIGGVCANFHGAAYATFDLDICCPFGLENVERIARAVGDLNPVHRLTPQELPLEATRPSFADAKNLYIRTSYGKLDCLGEVLGIGGFDEVKQRSVVGHFSYGEFRFLSLDALIEAKTAAARDHDLLTLRRLRSIKEKLSQRPLI